MSIGKSSFGFLFACCFMLPMSANAGLFGPGNYEECVLDNMKGITSDQAAGAVAAACRSKFSKPPEVDPEFGTGV